MENNYIGKRIKFLRKNAGLTMHKLGKSLGFKGSTADVRISQYESGHRVPKKKLIKKISEVLDVSPEAILPPDCDTVSGYMHLIFFLEERYGLTPFLCTDHSIGIKLMPQTLDLEFDRQVSTGVFLWMFANWLKRNDAMSETDYQNWKNNFPNGDLFHYVPKLETAFNALHEEYPDFPVFNTSIFEDDHRFSEND